MGSAQLVVGFVRGERRGAATPVEVVDDAVLSGRAPTTKQARHRRDSFRARSLTKRCRGTGVVLFAARRGAAMASRPHRAAPAASTTSRCSQRQEREQFFKISALRRALVACACCSVSKALGQPFRAFVCADRRWAPRWWRFGGGCLCLVGLSTFLSAGIGGFRSAFDLYLELRRQGGVPGHSDIPPAEPDVARSDAVE